MGFLSRHYIETDLKLLPRLFFGTYTLGFLRHQLFLEFSNAVAKGLWPLENESGSRNLFAEFIQSQAVEGSGPKV